MPWLLHRPGEMHSVCAADRFCPAAMPEKLLTVPEDAQTVVAALSGLLGEPFSGGRRSAGAASELFLHAFLPQTGCSRKQEDESADKSS